MKTKLSVTEMSALYSAARTLLKFGHDANAETARPGNASHDALTSAAKTLEVMITEATGVDVAAMVLKRSIKEKLF